tara:strand:+ start:256 stop:450 length:195 start_codon:yes stop_codon:yes gene_type:complete
MKNYRVYHWDTFDNETFLLSEFDTEQEAETFIEQRYKGRLSSSGADRVDVVDKFGNIIQSHPVG